MRQMSKIIAGVFVATFLLTAVCSNAAEVVWKGGSSKPQKDWFIGVTLPMFKHAFFESQIQACKDAGVKYGFRVEVRDAESDAAKQIDIVGDYIVKKADLIVICPVLGDALVSAVKQANAAGIPVVILNRTLGKGATTVTYVGADDYTGGQMQGELIAEALGGKGNVILLQGPLGTSPQSLRETGAESALSRYPDIKIIQKYPCEFDRAKALSATQDALVRYPKGKIDAIISQDSEMCMTALQAIKAAGRNELIGKIVAYDYPSYVKENILSGDFYGTVLQDPYQQAMISMDVVWLYLSGHKGHIPQPNFFTPLPKVTKETANLFPPSW